MTARGLSRGPGRPVNGRALTPAEREEIRMAHKAGQSQRSLAKKYKVTQPAIFAIVRPRGFAAIQAKHWNEVLRKLDGERVTDRGAT